MVSSREPTQEPLPQKSPSPAYVFNVSGKEGNALNEEAVPRVLMEMATGTSAISKMEAFNHVLDALKEAKERGTLHESDNTPKTGEFKFQTPPHLTHPIPIGPQD